jgi:uncharacterized damage-inducible protein DinB
MKPDFSDLTYAPYFERYMVQLHTRNVLVALNDSEARLLGLVSDLSAEKWQFAYAEGKWTLAQLVQHIIETELIFGFRALTFSRASNPETLPGFDENQYADLGNASLLTGSELISYFKSVRNTSRMLFSTTDSEQLLKVGNASNHDIQVEALFLLISAHTLHHAEIIEQRYL